MRLNLLIWILLSGVTVFESLIFDIFFIIEPFYKIKTLSFLIHDDFIYERPLNEENMFSFNCENQYSITWTSVSQPFLVRGTLT